MILRKVCLLVLPLVFLMVDNLHAQSLLQFDQASLHSPYIDSVYRHMSRKRRIAQLFIVPAYSNKNEAFQDSMARLIRKYQPGGLLFFQGGPVRQALLCNRYQDLLKMKALVAMDAEWGLGMRLDSTVSFPYQMTLGAINSNALIQSMAGQIARDFKRMGMQLNFAPDVDINNNPDNPVINFRSFGSNRDNVAEKGLAYIRGLQEHHVLATAKHFPGHGDTNVDSHLDLPVITITRKRLDSLELFPFRRIIAAGAAAVMSAHIHVVSLDSTPGLPATLSPRTINALLRQQMHFNGLVITDALNMLGLAKYYSPADAAVKALQAGNDMVEMSPDLPAALKGIRKAIRHRELSWDDIEIRCRKVILAKHWAGLNAYTAIDTASLIKDLNSLTAIDLVQQLSDSSLTLLKGEGKSIREGLQGGKTALLCIGNKIPSRVTDSLTASYHLPAFKLPGSANQVQIDSMTRLINAFGQIYLMVYDTRLRPRQVLNFTQPVLGFIARTALMDHTVSCFFTNAYALRSIVGIEKSKALILTYQDCPSTEMSVIKYLKGRIQAGGRLPVSISNALPFGTGHPESN